MYHKFVLIFKKMIKYPYSTKESADRTETKIFSSWGTATNPVFSEKKVNNFALEDNGVTR